MIQRLPYGRLTVQIQGNGLATVGDAELLEQVPDVIFDGIGGDAFFCCDLLVGSPRSQ